MAENLEVVRKSTVFASCLTAICSGLLNFVVPESTLNTYVMWTSIGILMLDDVYGRGADFLGKKFKDKNWYNILFAVKFGLLTGRNTTMSQNIIAALKNYSDQPTLLVIVGKAHVEGMKKLLETQNGFREISL